MGTTVTPTAITVNGVEHSVDADPDTPLLYVLRDHLGLKGTRFGCGLGQCGACHVLVDGRAVTSCDLPLWAVADRVVTTVEGLGTDEHPHPLRQAFVDEQAAQCGYCLSGILVTAAALLDADPTADEDRVRAALDRNLCRCGSHNRIVRAVLRAGEAMS
jgi:Aerobic-type carbon monoxide dehydrogenase, small subunit CoxS/CutS homologs